MSSDDFVADKNIGKERLNYALAKDVWTICKETSKSMNLDCTENSMALIAELMWKKLQLYGVDLELFAKHAKRNTVNADDVRLLVRRNDSLRDYLNTLVDSGKNLPKKRSTVAVATVTDDADKPSTSKMLCLDDIMDLT